MISLRTTRVFGKVKKFKLQIALLLFQRLNCYKVLFSLAIGFEKYQAFSLLLGICLELQQSMQNLQAQKLRCILRQSRWILSRLDEVIIGTSNVYCYLYYRFLNVSSRKA